MADPGDTLAPIEARHGKSLVTALALAPCFLQNSRLAGQEESRPHKVAQDRHTGADTPDYNERGSSASGPAEVSLIGGIDRRVGTRPG
jgi:hypothetical protein